MSAYRANPEAFRRDINSCPTQYAHSTLTKSLFAALMCINWLHVKI